MVRLKKWIECLTECFSQEKVSTLSLLFISKEDAFLRRRRFLKTLPRTKRDTYHCIRYP